MRYLPERNTGSKDGYFVVDGVRQNVYVKTELTRQARWDAAVKLSNGKPAIPFPDLTTA
jgi:hypothetical protein